MSPVFVQGVEVKDLVDYSTYASLPNTPGGFATLNGVAVWKDPNAEGMPWVPAFLAGWTLDASVHADTVNLGALPSGISITVSGAGTVTMSGGSIRCDSSATNTDYGLLTATFSTLADVGDAAVVFGAHVIDVGASMDDAATMLNRNGAQSQRVGFNPEWSGGMLLSNWAAAAQGGQGAARTDMAYFCLEANGGKTANEEVRCWDLEDPTGVAFAPGSAFTTAGSNKSFSAWAENASTNQAIVDIEFIAIYVR